MKKTLIALCLSCATFTTFAQAQETMTFSDLAANKSTNAEFQKLISKKSLPKWVAQGGTESIGKDVSIGNKHYIVLTACKPHDCFSENIAVLYSPETKKLSGVFSSIDKKGVQQKLQWLNIPDNLSIDGKTILFSALTGSLDNHPNNFKFD